MTDDSLYVGYFVNGKKEGKGVFTSKNEVYNGKFKDDYYHGKGEQYCIDT